MGMRHDSVLGNIVWTFLRAVSEELQYTNGFVRHVKKFHVLPLKQHFQNFIVIKYILVNLILVSLITININLPVTS